VEPGYRPIKIAMTDESDFQSGQEAAEIRRLIFSVAVICHQDVVQLFGIML
jgi:hypothetical protein